jgi:Ni/Co efflux regulator RcnB
VPFAFRGFAVANPYFYGLRPAPPGYRYVYLDNNIALMSVSSGLIVQVQPHIY